jgi:hypothetical protein
LSALEWVCCGRERGTEAALCSPAAVRQVCGRVGMPCANAFRKPFPQIRELARKRAGASLSSLRERGFQMIALKLAAIVIGVGALFSLFTPEFDADLLLAVVACFS